MTAPSTAIARRPATREIPLLTPEAMPTWRSSTESSTVAVSGATVASPEVTAQQGKMGLKLAAGALAWPALLRKAYRLDPAFAS